MGYEIFCIGNQVVCRDITMVTQELVGMKPRGDKERQLQVFLSECVMSLPCVCDI